MKKLILSTIAMASLAFAANAVTNMYVECVDGSVDIYDVDHVTELYYTEVQIVDGVSFTGKEGLYTYVDLGLPSGTMWATYNVGATKPTEYGDYFAWGETKPKKKYNLSTYKWYSSSSITKYCTYSDYGTVDKKKVLEADDDAATANWGSAWRMPTAEEQDELIKGCSWKWVKYFNGSGVSGRLGTSKANGATIFLPAAGYHYDNGLTYLGYAGEYWSSSLSKDDPGRANYLRIIDSDIYLFDYSRYCGQSVRAVLEEKKEYVVKEERKEYVVNFYDGDSVLIESQKVLEGMSADKVVAPKKDGYKFVGWSDSSFVNVKENLKIYALYEENVTVSGKVGIYTYVDLGLPSGTKWATYNVGATKPTEYGDYFAWGETKPKENYSWETYKLCDGSYSRLTKYCTWKNTVDDKTELEAEDDAATANWGSAWRMPTTEEQGELIEGCNWEWVENFNGSGVNGRLGSSTANGNKIFLPAAGYRSNTDLNYVGYDGYYWSSSLDEGSRSREAFLLDFDDISSPNLSDLGRDYGQSVRAVLK